VDELSSLFGLDCFGDHFIAEKASEAFKLGKARSLRNDVDQAHRLSRTSSMSRCLYLRAQRLSLGAGGSATELSATDAWHKGRCQ
jgi:hypothetical protein